MPRYLVAANVLRIRSGPSFDIPSPIKSIVGDRLLNRVCVVTFRWDDGWDHISFYLRDIGNHVMCLGGNQSDAVWVSVYHKKYVTSFRVP